MRAILIACTLALAGCAAQAPDPQAAAFKEWVSITKPRAESGELNHSDFYLQAHDRLAAIHTDDPSKLVLQRAFAEMIPVARAYEAGALTREQFDDVRRLTEVSIQQQNAAMEAQRQQAVAQALAAAGSWQRPTTQTNCVTVGAQVRCATR